MTSKKDLMCILSLFGGILIWTLFISDLDYRINIKYPIIFEDSTNDIANFNDFNFLTKTDLDKLNFSLERHKIDIESLRIDIDSNFIIFDIFIANLSSYQDDDDINVLLNFSIVDDFLLYTEIIVDLSDRTISVFHSVEPNIYQSKFVFIPLANRISFEIPREYFLEKKLMVEDYDVGVIIWENIHDLVYLDVLYN
jgi:hypothetical protein